VFLGQGNALLDMTEDRVGLYTGMFNYFHAGCFKRLNNLVIDAILFNRTLPVDQ
jgi:hypothetical protein